MTRLDETVQPGIAIDCMIRSSGRVCLWTDSAQPQHALNPASARCLVEYAFDQEGLEREEFADSESVSDEPEQAMDEEADVDLTKFAGLSLEA